LRGGSGLGARLVGASIKSGVLAPGLFVVSVWLKSALIIEQRFETQEGGNKKEI